MPGGGLAVYRGRCALVFFAASAHLRHGAHTEWGGKEEPLGVRTEFRDAAVVVAATAACPAARTNLVPGYDGPLQMMMVRGG